MTMVATVRKVVTLATGELRLATPYDAGEQDLLGSLIAVRDPETGVPIAVDEVCDQCATMIFAGYETTSRLLFLGVLSTDARSR